MNKIKSSYRIIVSYRTTVSQKAVSCAETNITVHMNLSQLHLLALNVGCCIHDGDWNWKNVRSPFSRLYCVTEGSAKVELPSGTISLKPGHLYFIPAYMQHNCICNSHFTHYYIHIFEDVADGSGLLEDLDLPFEVKAEDGDFELMKRLCEINPTLKIPESNPQAYDNHKTLIANYQKNLRRPFCDKVESRGIMFILLSRFLNQAKLKNLAEDDRIRHAISYMRKHIGENLDIEKLADNACMSKVHFFRMFKEQTGETPNAYFIKKRMEKAELLLITTEMPIKTIAVNLGYEDHSYFIRLFKKYSGITPQQYRERRI